MENMQDVMKSDFEGRGGGHPIREKNVNSPLKGMLDLKSWHKVGMLDLLGRQKGMLDWLLRPDPYILASIPFN